MTYIEDFKIHCHDNFKSAPHFIATLFLAVDLHVPSYCYRIANAVIYHPSDISFWLELHVPVDVI